MILVNLSSRRSRRSKETGGLFTTSPLDVTWVFMMDGVDGVIFPLWGVVWGWGLSCQQLMVLSKWNITPGYKPTYQLFTNFHGHPGREKLFFHRNLSDASVSFCVTSR